MSVLDCSRAGIDLYPALNLAQSPAAFSVCWRGGANDRYINTPPHPSALPITYLALGTLTAERSPRMTYLMNLKISRVAQVNGNQTLYLANCLLFLGGDARKEKLLGSEQL